MSENHAYTHDWKTVHPATTTDWWTTVGGTEPTPEMLVQMSRGFTFPGYKNPYRGMVDQANRPCGAYHPVTNTQWYSDLFGKDPCDGTFAAMEQGMTFEKYKNPFTGRIDGPWQDPNAPPT
jgi:hypothetical protein